MRRWTVRHLAALALTGLLVGLLAPVGASAAAPPKALHVRTGITKVTTAPGVATALVRNGILALATRPGRSSTVRTPHGPALVATFPVTGGQVTLRPPAALLRHAGGLLLVNAKQHKRVAIDAFVIDTRARWLTAHLVGTRLRLPVFALDLRHASLRVRGHVVTISGVGLRLTQTAAGALNHALQTRLFTANLPFGTATTSVVVS